MDGKEGCPAGSAPFVRPWPWKGWLAKCSRPWIALASVLRLWEKTALLLDYTPFSPLEARVRRVIYRVSQTEWALTNLP